VLGEHGALALQYGPTEGDAGLLAEIARLMEADGTVGLGPDRLMVTSGSQQALDLVSRVFLAPGDAVLCGLPTYLGALGAFSAAGARLAGVPLDEHGLRIDILEQRLVELRRSGVRPKLVYVVPDFQNPAGVTLGLERRTDLLQIARDFELLVVEDSPYRALRYAGQALPSVASLDREGRVIGLYTFSKILSPGLRLGWVVADPEIVARLVVAKQAVDLCTSSLAQVLAREFLRTGRLEAWIERTRALYALKLEAFAGALEDALEPSWGVCFRRPEGGLFLWVALPAWMSARRLLDHALRENVAFVCGSAFHCDGSGANTLRLNFSYPSVEQLREAARRLARALARMRTEVPAARAQTEPRSIEVPLASGEHSLDQLSWNLALTEVVV
jgi:2-aminoadipate transaminase